MSGAGSGRILLFADYLVLILSEKLSNWQELTGFLNTVQC